MLVTYAAGIGHSDLNTSSRIATIRDAHSGNSQNPTYTLVYNHDATPHLEQVNNAKGVVVRLDYTSPQALHSPFQGEVEGQPGTVVSIEAITDRTTSLKHTFLYSSSSTAELAQVTTPFGGHIRWSYGNETLNDGNNTRVVSSRFLAWDDLIGERVYELKRVNEKGGRYSRSVKNVTSGASESWTFSGSHALPQTFDELNSSGKVWRSAAFQWSQDPASRYYLSAKIVTKQTGAASVSRRIIQQKDQYGNLLQYTFIDFGESAPSKQFTRTFLQEESEAVGGRKVARNRLLSLRSTVKGKTSTFQNSSGRPLGSFPGEQISGLQSEVLLARSDISAAIFTYPLLIHQPKATQSKTGRITYTYSPAAPQITAHIGQKWTKTYLDGLGRVAKRETGNASGKTGGEEYIYDTVGSSAFGRVVKTASASSKGGSAVAMQRFEYDSAGEILSASGGYKAPQGQLFLQLRTTHTEDGKEVVRKQVWSYSPVTQAWQVADGMNSSLGLAPGEEQRLLKAELSRIEGASLQQLVSGFTASRGCSTPAPSRRSASIRPVSFSPLYGGHLETVQQCGPPVDSSGNCLVANPGTIQTVNSSTPVFVIFPDGTSGFVSIDSTITYMTDDPSILDQAIQWLGTPQGQVTVAVGLTLVALAQPELAPVVLALSESIDAGLISAATAAGIAEAAAYEIQEIDDAALEALPEGERLVLGTSSTIQAFGSAVGANNLMGVPGATWQQTFIQQASNPNIQKLFNLDNLVNAAGGAAGSIQEAMQANNGVAFELNQINANPQWWPSITFWQTMIGGVMQQVPNPLPGN